MIGVVSSGRSHYIATRTTVVANRCHTNLIMRYPFRQLFQCFSGVLLTDTPSSFPALSIVRPDPDEKRSAVQLPPRQTIALSGNLPLTSTSADSSLAASEFFLVYVNSTRINAVLCICPLPNSYIELHFYLPLPTRLLGRRCTHTTRPLLTGFLITVNNAG